MKDKILKLGRYIIVGGTSSILEFIVFYILINFFGLYYIFSNTIAFFCALFYGFLLQKKFTFRNNSKEYKKQFILFLMVTGISLLFSNFLLYLFHGILFFNIYVSKLLQVLITFAWNFLGQNYIVFKQDKSRIDLMRLIDYYLGIPITFVFSIFYFFKSIFIKKKYPIKDPKNILLIKLFGLGSIVLTVPSIKELKNKYPNSNIFFLTFKSNKGIFDVLGIIKSDNIITLDDSSILKLFISIFKALILCWRNKIDVVIDFEFFSRFTSIFSFLVRSKYRIGFFNYNIEGLYRGNFLTHKIFYNHNYHVSILFKSLVESMDQPYQIPFVKKHIDDIKLYYKINVDDNDKISIKNKLINYGYNGVDKIFIFNINTSDIGGNLRRWEKEKYADLYNKIITNHKNITICFIGARSEEEYVLDCINKIKDKSKLINLAGKTSLKELVSLFSIGDYFITCDSGPMHLAALTDKNIAIYLKLYCQPCLNIYNGKKPFCSSNKCIKDLSSDYVYNIIKRYL